MVTKEKNVEKLEREYVIPLRKKGISTVSYKKTPKAIKTIKEFVAKHMKIKDRDLNKIKLDKYLNEAIWHRGIKNPIHKIRVKVIKQGEIVEVYPLDLPKNINFKKIREEKKSKEQTEIGEKAKKEIEARKKAEKEAEEKESEEEITQDLNNNGVDDKIEKKEKEKINEGLAQKEMKEKAKENKDLPKKINKQVEEKMSSDKSSQGK
jgi:large subunit ribosomal protein L31e